MLDSNLRLICRLVTMHTYEIILIVSASIGLAVAVSMALLSIPQYDTIQIFLETFGLALGEIFGVKIY